MLCSACTSLDISKLLKSARDDGAGKYRSFGDKLTEQALERSPNDFFAQHRNLEAVRYSASSCDLCHAIWEDYRRYCTQPYTSPAGYQPDASSLVMRSEGSLGPGQIYITARPHSKSAVYRHDKSQMVAFRHGDKQSFQILAWFDVFVEDHETVDAPEILLKPVALDARFASCFHRAQEWLDDCLNNHKSCQIGNSEFPLPTRVLEILSSEADSACNVRLVDGAGQVAPFAALSYSWGGESAQMLTRDSMNLFRKGFPSSELPATMRDAVTIAKRMSLRYIWIDALCIFQDDRDDFARESAKMRDIYRGALFTINGSTAGKISDGLLVDRPQPSWTCKLPWTNEDGSTAAVHLRSCNERSEVSVERSPINNRGWCLQENVLAQRTLWIGTPVNIFECASGQVDETGRSRESTERYRSKAHIGTIGRERRLARFRQLARFVGIPVVVHYQWPKLGMIRSRPRAVLIRGAAVGTLQSNDTVWTYYDHWREIVLVYCRRQLSARTDILPALSGLAAHFHQALRDVYLAGIWKHDIVRGLNWTWMPERNYKLSDTLVAPSWSWASVQPSPIFYHDCAWHERINIRTRLLQHSIKLTTADPFGEIEEAYIVMQGPFLLLPTPFPQVAASEDPSTLLGTVYERECQPRDLKSEFLTRHKPYEGQQFGLLHLFNVEQRPYGYMLGRPDRADDVHEHANLLLIETCEDKPGWRRVGKIRFRLAWSMIDPAKSESYRDEFYSHAWVRRDIHLV